MSHLSTSPSASKQAISKKNESCFIARSRKMKKILNLTIKLAHSDVPVLIEGESGTGKDLIARAIHENSPRRKQPFISENCAAFPETLMETEFFGVSRGAFTGAEASREGILERVRGGTLFLDEVGELSLSIQAKLLRALEEMRSRRVGGSKSQKLKFRLISATNRKLENEVRMKRFRLDLQFRLEVVKIHIPPLRERIEEIPHLVEHFLKAHRSPQSGPHPKLTEQTLKLFKSYWWPGNVRELKNEIARAVAFGHETIQPEHLSARLLSSLTNSHPPTEQQEDYSIHDAEKELLGALIGRALVNSKGNCTKAAKSVGLTRPSFYRRLHRYGIVPEEILRSGPKPIRETLLRYGFLD